MRAGLREGDFSVWGINDGALKIRCLEGGGMLSLFGSHLTKCLNDGGGLQILAADGRSIRCVSPNLTGRRLHLFTRTRYSVVCANTWPHFLRLFSWPLVSKSLPIPNQPILLVWMFSGGHYRDSSWTTDRAKQRTGEAAAVGDTAVLRY